MPVFEEDDFEILKDKMADPKVKEKHLEKIARLKKIREDEIAELDRWWKESE